MGLFGGGNSKSNQTTNNESNAIGIGGENSGVNLNGDSNYVKVTETDHGSINAAFELGNSSLDFAGDGLDNFLDVTDSLTGKSFDFSSEILSKSMDSVEESNNGLLSIVADSMGFASESQDKVLAAANADAKMSSDVLKLVGFSVLTIGVMMAMTQGGN